MLIRIAADLFLMQGLSMSSSLCRACICGGADKILALNGDLPSGLLSWILRRMVSAKRKSRKQANLATLASVFAHTRNLQKKKYDNAIGLVFSEIQ